MTEADWVSPRDPTPKGAGDRPRGPRGPRSSARISPTAHFTGYVWYRNGLGDRALMTRAGRLLVAAYAPFERAAAWAGVPTLEDTLLSRHRAIDDLLERAIEAGTVTQVLEVAAGLSPRGLRFTRRYGSRIRYLEADLPAMARRKQEALTRAGERGAAGPGHDVVELDALATAGPLSLPEVAAARLDPAEGLAILTEGLVNYFNPRSLEGMWRRIAQVLGRHPQGLYLSDIVLRSATGATQGTHPVAGALSQMTTAALISLVSRGRLHAHYGDEGEAGRALLAAGFAEARLHPAGRVRTAGASPSGSAPVHVIEARAGSDAG